jgi:hypothetical protein
VIQFPQGFDSAPPVTPVTDRNAVLGGHAPNSRIPAARAPVDVVTLQSTAMAALELELLRVWESGPGRAAGAAEYQVARQAFQSGDSVAALEHLGHAIQAQPSYAATAVQDPEWNEIREPVRDLVSRMTAVARIHAESSIVEAGALVRALHAAGSIPQAQAYLDMAQAQFQLSAYAGYVQAAQAAALAEQTALQGERTVVGYPAKVAASDSLIRLSQIKAAVTQATRRLWQTLPLLAILFGWLMAGIVAGLVSLPFQNGSVSGLRQLLFTVWALGLLGMIVLGFLRSIRHIRIWRP